MYFHSPSSTLVAVTDVLSVRKRLAVNDLHRIAHFGRLLLEIQESVKRQPLIPAGAPLDCVPKAKPSSGCVKFVSRSHSGSEATCMSEAVSSKPSKASKRWLDLAKRILVAVIMFIAVLGFIVNVAELVGV